MEAAKRSSSGGERSNSSEGLAKVVSASDANLPRARELDSQALPDDLKGLASQLGPLLRRWISQNYRILKGIELNEPSKHRSTAEVFPLPVPTGHCLQTCMTGLKPQLEELVSVGGFDLS